MPSDSKGHLRNLGNAAAEIYTTYGMFIILIVILIVCSVMSDVFLNGTNISNVLRNMSTVALVAFGMTFLLILGMIDLSAGSVMAFAGCVCCIIIRETESVPLGMIIGIIIGGLFGLVNGGVVAYFRIPAFIMTLGSQSIARGAALLITGGNPVSNIGDVFKQFGQGYMDTWKIIPIPIVTMLIFFGITWVLLNRTKFGRHVVAMGGNENAARASGVGPKSTVIKAFLLEGLLVGLAGVMLMSRLNSGQPNGATGYEFDAITAAVVGGTSLMGGIGNIQGAFVGCLIIGVLNNIMNLYGVSSFWQMVVKGVIIALAVIIDYKTKDILQRKG
jgi:inositol transport system permease protein